MVIFIILLGIIIWYFVSFHKEKNKQIEKLNLKGGFHNAYYELLSFFYSFPGATAIDKSSTSITILVRNNFAITHFFVSHNFGKIHVRWEFQSVEFGEHKLKWVFPEYQLQSSMINVVKNDVVNYIDSNLYKSNNGMGNITDTLENISSNLGSNVKEQEIKNITEIKCAMKLRVNDGSNIHSTRATCNIVFRINYNNETIMLIDKDKGYSELHTKHIERSNFSGLDNTFFVLTSSASDKVYLTIYKSGEKIKAVRVTDENDNGWFYLEANYILEKMK